MSSGGHGNFNWSQKLDNASGCLMRTFNRHSASQCTMQALKSKLPEAKSRHTSAAVQLHHTSVTSLRYQRLCNSCDSMLAAAPRALPPQ